ncbi:MAG: hypothetical protein U1E17_11965 [Geminicoccaceae bacterium]
MAEPAHGLWPWLPLIGLGLFHGLNPAMGWLFAVALGLHRQSRRVVLLALLPIALGHALAVLLVVLAVLAFGRLLDPDWVDRAAGLVLIGWGLWHLLRGGHRGRVRFGMRTGMLGLGAWSFLMASAHGAGLMLIPFLPGAAMEHAQHQHGSAAVGWDMALLAVLVHSLAMLAATGLAALLVYDWLGVAVLRRGWINLDLLWSAALVLVGLWLLL